MYGGFWTDMVIVGLCLLAMIVGLWLYAADMFLSPETICARHLGWSQLTCQRVSEHEIWLGMTREEAKASRPLGYSVNRTVTDTASMSSGSTMPPAFICTSTTGY
jgi:hypothetical protein